MASVYLITNNSFMSDRIVYKDYTDLDEKRKYRPLSVNGEKIAVTIAKKKVLEDIHVLYSSPFFHILDSSKYLADKLNLDVIVDKRLQDRVVGDYTDSNMNLRYLQEHDFDYKLTSGESLNDVKFRMTNFLKEVLKEEESSNIAVYTHNICLLSILSVWCKKGFNFEEKLMLEYNEQVIIDGLKNDYNIIKLEFDKDILKSIKKIS